MKKKASFGTNVTEVLNWVAKGSASCGVVYATDAASNKDVKVLAEAPADALKTPVIYPVAALKKSKNKVKTGDNSNATLFAILLLVSGTGLLIIAISRYREKYHK